MRVFAAKREGPEAVADHLSQFLAGQFGDIVVIDAGVISGGLFGGVAPHRVSLRFSLFPALDIF